LSTHSLSEIQPTTRVSTLKDGAVRTGWWLPAFTLWQRELVRFYRQRSRVIGVIGSPIVFWLLLGAGFGNSFKSSDPLARAGYLQYFFPGTIVLILLFTAIFTMMSVIEDRKEGFLLSVLVAPCPRTSIVLGKVLGGATLATAQGLLFTAIAPLLGIHLTLLSWLSVAGVLTLVSFALTGAGFLIAWHLDSTHAFHAIVNLFLLPAWLLSGALFPIAGAASWVRWLMLLNPLTYGTTALRGALGWSGLDGAARHAALVGIVVTFGFDLLVLAVGMWMVQRESRRTPR